MENITNENFQKARRISRAIQEYLEFTGNNGARSTDVYDFLANKGVIEKDSHQGVHFRKFLKRLKDNDLLKLIPQCSYSYSSNGMHEWYFHKSKKVIATNKSTSEQSLSHRAHFPSISESEINELIEKLNHTLRSFRRDMTSGLLNN